MSRQMNETLRNEIGKTVRIWSVSGESEVSDEGTLEGFDDPFIRLRKGSELLLFPVHRIRLMKLVD